MFKHYGWLFVLLGLTACQGSCPGNGEGFVKRVEAFSSSYLADLARLERASNEAYWKASNSGSEADFDAFAKANVALLQLHSDKARWAELQHLLTRAAELPALQRRSLQVAELAFRENQLPPELIEKMVNSSTEIERIFNTYRVELEGKKVSNNELLEALAQQKDSARRQAIWLSLKEVGGQVGPKLVALAKVRNEAAKQLGYANFWEMRVRLQEYSPDALVKLFEQLDQVSAKPFAEMKARLDGELATRLGVPADQLMPWHYDDPFFQAAPPSAAVDPDDFYKGKTREQIVETGARFFADIGLPVEDLVARSDFYEREGKDQHAFCMAMDRQGDVRMLLNVKPTASWMDTMLHETGHAAYYKFLDYSLPYNLRESAHIFTTEAVAMMFGALARTPEWLKTYVGVPAQDADAKAAALKEQRLREQLIFTRWTLVMFNFERGLYENPDQDLNTLWYQLVGRYQGLKKPEGRDAPDWAAKPHFTIAPVYYHNYMLGELFAARLRSSLATLAGWTGPSAALPWGGRKDFGQFLQDKVFRPGMTLPWAEFVKEATGREMDASDYAKEVGGVL